MEYGTSGELQTEDTMRFYLLHTFSSQFISNLISEHQTKNILQSRWWVGKLDK